MIIIDEERIFQVISERKPISVALNGPDGILPKVQKTATNIMEKFGIPAFILADTTWGTCDLNSNGAKVLGAEILFNIGHTNKLETFENNVVMINAFDDISFEKVLPKCIEKFKGKIEQLAPRGVGNKINSKIRQNFGRNDLDWKMKLPGWLKN